MKWIIVVVMLIVMEKTKVEVLYSNGVDVDYVFTDSHNDMPLIKICKMQGFIIKNNNVKTYY